jgi:hypothetical protein
LTHHPTICLSGCQALFGDEGFNLCGFTIGKGGSSTHVDAIDGWEQTNLRVEL